MAQKRQCDKSCRKCKIKMLGNLHKKGMEDCNSGKLTEADLKLREALEIARDLRMKVLEANTLNSLGIVCALRGVNNEACQCYNKALNLINGKINEKHFFHKTINTNLSKAIERM